LLLQTRADQQEVLGLPSANPVRKSYTFMTLRGGATPKENRLSRAESHHRSCGGGCGAGWFR
ncbi:unnamed protein product, partial [Amoebophrya sp. A25]